MLTRIATCLLLQCAFAAAQPAPPYLNAENTRSDTFDVLKYTIDLEIGTATSQTISGATAIRFAPRINGQTFIRLDLLKLTVDSVKEGATKLSYQYNDTILNITFSGPKNITDTSVIHVYYHGQPKIDGSGWGGFYFNNTQGAQYAFNLGVGFAAEPHNYGRTWFPCFDNFVERSEYDFVITSDSSRKAYCGGLLLSDVVSGSKRTRTWRLTEEIPSYLASVAVADYAQVFWMVNTLSGPKPVIIAAHSSDTSAVKSAFVNLNNCVAGFEHYFGPYRWNRVGYSLVPFSGGAMEHAANIAFPRAPGLLTSEELMSHEFAHHWWGNLITCETPEDMWINEGMASLSAHLFFEWQYGKASYLQRVKTQHEELLHFLHKREGSFHAISGVAHDMTYSDHVYKKGAVAGHSLRGYMGDSAFFNACKYVMQQKAFQSINSNELRDLMQQSSGQNLQNFFNDWIYNGGWPHFAIDSVRYAQSGQNILARVSVKQKVFGAPALYSNVPLEMSFFKSDWSRAVHSATMNGATATFTFLLPFQPTYCALNYDSHISDATSHESRVIKSAGPVNFTLGKALVTVITAGADSSLMRVVHNYVPPDALKNNQAGHIFSDQRYWRVEGILSQGFDARIRLTYDGSKGTTGPTTYLDTLLTRVNGDSIAVFYRPDAGADWELVKGTTKTKLSPKMGYIEVPSLKIGEYTFANLGDTTLSTVSVSQNSISNPPARIYPNPAAYQLTLEITKPATEMYTLNVYDGQGRLAFQRSVRGGITLVDLSPLREGNYVVEVSSKGKVLLTTKLLLD